MSKYHRYHYGQEGGYFLSTHDEYRRAMKKEDRLREKEKTKQRTRAVLDFFKSGVTHVRSHPIIFSVVAILVIAH